MKKTLYILTLAFGLIWGQRASAQDYKEAERRAECHTQWMTKELRLKSNQVQKVHDVNLDIAKKLEDYKYKSTDVADITQKAKDLDVERSQRLEMVLSPEQLFRYEKVKDKTNELAGACILASSH